MLPRASDVIPYSRDVISQRNGIRITDFEKCDFRPMFEHFENEDNSLRASFLRPSFLHC